MLHATRPIRVIISHIIRGRFERRRSLETYSFKNRCAKVGGSHQHSVKAATLKPATEEMRDDNSDGSRRVQHGRGVRVGVI